MSHILRDHAAVHVTGAIDFVYEMVYITTMGSCEDIPGFCSNAETPVLSYRDVSIDRIQTHKFELHHTFIQSGIFYASAPGRAICKIAGLKDEKEWLDCRSGGSSGSNERICPVKLQRIIQV